MKEPDIHAILPHLASAAAFTQALGFEHVGVMAERVRIRVPWRENLMGDPATNVLSGGVVSALMDHAGGLSVWLAVGHFEPIATLDMRIDYMRPARPYEAVIAEARCFRLTRSIAFVRAWAFENDPDDPVAAAQIAYILKGPANEQPRAGG